MQQSSDVQQGMSSTIWRSGLLCRLSYSNDPNRRTQSRCLLVFVSKKFRSVSGGNVPQTARPPVALWIGSSQSAAQSGELNMISISWEQLTGSGESTVSEWLVLNSRTASLNPRPPFRANTYQTAENHRRRNVSITLEGVVGYRLE